MIANKRNKNKGWKKKRCCMYCRNLFNDFGVKCNQPFDWRDAFQFACSKWRKKK